VKQFLRRYRWWLLLLVAIAGLASWSLWPNAMRKHYERLKLDMTPFEVNWIMGRSGNIVLRDAFFTSLGGVQWKTIASEGLDPAIGDREAVWCDDHIGVTHAYICVTYKDGQAVHKIMRVRMAPWEMKLREWLRRLGISIS
jgi:hypothetical protein